MRICIKDTMPLLQIWRSRFGVLLLCCFPYYKTNFASLCPWPSPIKVYKEVLVIISCVPVFSLICWDEFSVCTMMFTAISRQVVGENVHVTVPKSSMIKLYTVPDNSSCWAYFCCFPLALANMLCPWPLVPFFQISLKNMYSELKATHTYLSGLSCALFATMFLEIADVYLICCIFLY